MSRFIILILLILAATAGSFWLSQNTGDIYIDIFSYQIKTSVIWALLVIFSAILAIALVFKIIKTIVFLPKKIVSFFKNKQAQHVRKLEIKMISALLENDNTKITDIAEALKKQSSEHQLKEIYSILKYKNNTQELERILQQHELNKASRKMALLLSSTQYENINEKSKALENYLELWQVEKSPANFSKICKLFFQLNKINEAEDFIENNNGLFSHEFLSKHSYKKLSSIIYYYKALDFNKAKNYQEAISYLQKSNKAYPEFFLPICTLNSMIANGQYSPKSLKFASYAIEEIDNAFLTNSLINAANFIDDSEFYNFAKNAYDNNKTFETTFLLAKASLNKELYDNAFKLISELLETSGKNSRICILMAEFCERTQGSTSESLKWLMDSYSCMERTNYHNIYFDFNKFDFFYQPSQNSILIKHN